MNVTNTKESGFESLIVDWLVNKNGYEQGSNEDYNREYAVDETRLFRFLQDTQPESMERLGVFKSDLKKKHFLHRVNSELLKRGAVNVLRNGIKVYPVDLIMFYMTPSAGNPKAMELHKKNIFSVTRQLQYSQVNTRLALDMGIFINGIPVITFELKNQLTKQNVGDAVLQYKKDRDPREILFQFKRCMVHFAVDDAGIKFCTKLCGKESWFLPFNKGYNSGAGNPPNPDGIMTDYLWKDILTKQKLCRIIENYVQIVESTDPDTMKVSVKQIFPRYHQLDAVEKLLDDVRQNGIGKRYLIQHSAGSGKSNSIAWLAYQLAGMEKDNHPLLDSVLVVTDRRILDRQIRDALKQFMQVPGYIAWAEHSDDLRKAVINGKRIIITTIEKFPYIVSEIGDSHKNNKFAIIIDEAHSGQSGRTAAKMNIALSGSEFDELDYEDKINDLVEKRKLLKNASYFAFTATPKNKTLEMFGVPYRDGGEIKHRPFHNYSMKQAIQEGFILDVLENYTPIQSYYRLLKSVEEDPEFDKKRSKKKLRCFVESDEFTIAKKAEIMVEHFHANVIGKAKIAGQARAMVVTMSIPRCVQYYYAIKTSLENRRSPYKAIIAYSGEYKTDSEKQVLTSAGRNGFPDVEIPKRFKKDPYRILIVADMFQTGFDEPLLHTMYVDKVLCDIKAVQTLSRLNRAHPKKHDTFVLDFANDTEIIKESFSRYYQTTILSAETDPNKLHDLETLMESYQIYTQEQVEKFVKCYLENTPREKLDALLDNHAALYKELPDDDKIKFKSAAKSFCRVYAFLGIILPIGKPEWEKLSIFLNLLIPKLPAPQEPDLSQGILEMIDFDSYRIEAQQTLNISLEDKDAEIDPISPNVAKKIDMELDVLSSILDEFNELFGNIQWNDADNVRRQIKEIPEMVAKNKAYRNAIKNSDEQNARLESDRALEDVMLDIMTDNIELFKQFQDNPSFKQWLCGTVFTQTYRKARGQDSMSR